MKHFLTATTTLTLFLFSGVAQAQLTKQQINEAAKKGVFVGVGPTDKKCIDGLVMRVIDNYTPGYWVPVGTVFSVTDTEDAAPNDDDDGKVKSKEDIENEVAKESPAQMNAYNMLSEMQIFTVTGTAARMKNGKHERLNVTAEVTAQIMPATRGSVCTPASISISEVINENDFSLINSMNFVFPEKGSLFNNTKILDPWMSAD